MRLLTFFIIMFFASVMALIFFYFNKWEDEEAGETFWEEIKRDIFNK